MNRDTNKLLIFENALKEVDQITSQLNSILNIDGQGRCNR